MKVVRYRGDGSAADVETVRESAAHLARGEIIAGPSDTVYGLLGMATHADALKRLREIKGREGRFIILVASLETAREWCPSTTPGLWSRLEAVWPGPVTVILPAAGGMGASLGSTLAIRMPDHPYLTDLLELVESPLFSTSANFPGKPAPMGPEAVASALGSLLSLLVEGGPATRTEPSTLVDMTRNPPEVLRAGSGDARPLLDPCEGPL